MKKQINHSCQGRNLEISRETPCICKYTRKLLFYIISSNIWAFALSEWNLLNFFLSTLFWWKTIRGVQEWGWKGIVTHSWLIAGKNSIQNSLSNVLNKFNSLKEISSSIPFKSGTHRAEIIHNFIRSEWWIAHCCSQRRELFRYTGFWTKQMSWIPRDITFTNVCLFKSGKQNLVYINCSSYVL